MLTTNFTEFKHLANRLYWLTSEGREDTSEADDLRDRLDVLLASMTPSDAEIAKKLSKQLTDPAELR